MGPSARLVIRVPSAEIPEVREPVKELVDLVSLRLSETEQRLTGDARTAALTKPGGN